MRLITAVLATCLALPAAAQEEPTADTVVATVNGVDITLGQMIVARAELPAQYQQLPDDVLFGGVLDQLIQQELLAGTLEEGDLPNRVRIALENEQRLLLAGEVVQQLVDDTLTDENVQAFYDENVGGGEPTMEFNASHILVETLEEAEAVLERLDGGEAFADLAIELSQDPGSGANGGSLGWFGQGMMVAPFEEAVMSLDAGAVSAPVETQFGFHIITLNETREQTPPALEDIRAEIEEAMRNEAIQERLASLTDEGEITRPEDGAFDPAILLQLELLRD